MNNDLVYRLNHVLTAEEILVAEVNKTTEMQRLRSARKELLAIIRAVARSGELEWMVATEKTIVEGDLSRYANSKAMTNSLKAALTDIASIEKHLVMIADQSQYRIVDAAHGRPRNRKNDLPFDEARQALASHHARLTNIDKSRLDDDEKAIVDARKSAIHAQPSKSTLTGRKKRWALRHKDSPALPCRCIRKQSGRYGVYAYFVIRYPRFRDYKIGINRGVFFVCCSACAEKTRWRPQRCPAAAAHSGKTDGRTAGRDPRHAHPHGARLAAREHGDLRHRHLHA